jgi:hypothetical protein
MSETAAHYTAPRRRPQPGDVAAATRRLGIGIGAAIVCEQYALSDPASDIPALINIAFAADQLRQAAARAVNGDDIAAYVTADNRLRELLEQFAGTQTDAPTGAAA